MTKKSEYSGTSLIRSSKMRTPPSTGHHQESSCFCFVCFCQINLGGASGLVACARMAIITLYSVPGRCKSWTLDSGLDHGLDRGLDGGLDFGPDFGPKFGPSFGLVIIACFV